MNWMMSRLWILVAGLFYPGKSTDLQSLPDTFRWRERRTVCLMVVQRTIDFHLKQFRNDCKDYVHDNNFDWTNSTKQREFLLNLLKDQKLYIVSQVMTVSQANKLFEATLCLFFQFQWHLLVIPVGKDQYPVYLKKRYEKWILSFPVINFSFPVYFLDAFLNKKFFGHTFDACVFGKKAIVIFYHREKWLEKNLCWHSIFLM